MSDRIEDLREIFRMGATKEEIIERMTQDINEAYADVEQEKKSVNVTRLADARRVLAMALLDYFYCLGVEPDPVDSEEFNENIEDMVRAIEESEKTIVSWVSLMKMFDNAVKETKEEEECGNGDMASTKASEDAEDSEPSADYIIRHFLKTLK